MTSDPVVFVWPGDLHLEFEDRPNYKTALWMADEVNDLIRPDFVQFAGDNVQHAREPEWALFQNVTDKLKVPWHVGEMNWSFPIPGDTLAKGEHTLEVRLTDATDAEGSDRITFACDLSGRYNPYPMVEPIVRETKFC